MVRPQVQTVTNTGHVSGTLGVQEGTYRVLCPCRLVLVRRNVDMPGYFVSFRLDPLSDANADVDGFHVVGQWLGLFHRIEHIKHVIEATLRKHRSNGDKGGDACGVRILEQLQTLCRSGCMRLIETRMHIIQSRQADSEHKTVSKTPEQVKVLTRKGAAGEYPYIQVRVLQYSLQGTAHIAARYDSLRSRHALDMTLERLFLLHAPENVLLVTSTFHSGISRREAKLRFDKLLRKLRDHVDEYLWVFERGHGGHVHFHLLLVVKFDTRKGVDLDAYAGLASDALSAKRKLVNKPTRELWTMVDVWTRKFGIGRTEVAPLYKDPRAICLYLAKSVRHNWSNREVAGGPGGRGDKGACWWSSSRGLKAVYGKFSFFKSKFREGVKLYAELHGLPDLDSVKRHLGPRWGWAIHTFMESIRPAGMRKPGVPFAAYMPGGATVGAPDAWNLPRGTGIVHDLPSVKTRMNTTHAASVIASRLGALVSTDEGRRRRGGRSMSPHRSKARGVRRGRVSGVENMRAHRATHQRPPRPQDHPGAGNRARVVMCYSGDRSVPMYQASSTC